MKFGHYLLAACVLTAIVLICFGRTLGSYFVADDFGQVCYVGGVSCGDWKTLLANITGSYMQVAVMKIYRPCLLLSLLFDYKLWHINAFGYFLTNILFLIASALMLYVLLRQLTISWENNRSTMFALLSAALFASSPLHCESVSFVSGRDNIMSAFFYLLALWCFVRKGKGKGKALLITGVISFWIAMLSKELAIGLPVVLTTIVFFLPELFDSKAIATSEASELTSQHSLKERLILAIKVSLPIWVNTAIYLLVRFLTLGTVAGGYTGSIGSGLMSTLVERWTNPDIIFRIIYPLNLEVFGASSDYARMLSGLYVLLSAVVIGKFLSGKCPLRWLGLVTIWLLTTIAPLYQLWGLGDNLEGSRFYFFATIPLAILIPLLIFAPTDKTGVSKSGSIVTGNGEAKKVEAAGLLAAVALVILCVNITYKDNIPWIHAGRQTKACLAEGQRLATSIDSGKKVALLGIPKQHAGAHVIYNGATFSVMMSPPFSRASYGDKFITFDPIFYGADEFVNLSRLKKVLCDPNVVGLYVWNDKTLKFDRLVQPSCAVLIGAKEGPPLRFINDASVAPSISNKEIKNNDSHLIWIHNSLKNHRLLIAPLNLDPYQYDFIKLSLKAPLAGEPIIVYWAGAAPNSLDLCDSRHTAPPMGLAVTPTANVRIRLSDHWRWFTQGNINQLQLEFLPGQSIEVKDVQLISAKELVPEISIRNARPNNMGVYTIGKDNVCLEFDASAIKDCAAVKIEVSKPNYFFEGMSQKAIKDAIMTTAVQTGRKGQLKIAGDVFSLPGYYELRALCLDKKGIPIGERSDSITIGF